MGKTKTRPRPRTRPKVRRINWPSADELVAQDLDKLRGYGEELGVIAHVALEHARKGEWEVYRNMVRGVSQRARRAKKLSVKLYELGFEGEVVRRSLEAEQANRMLAAVVGRQQARGRGADRG